MLSNSNFIRIPLLFNRSRLYVDLVQRTIYGDAFLKIDQFKKSQDFFEKKYKKDKKYEDMLHNKVKKSIEDNKLDYSFANLNDLLFLTRKNSKLDSVIDATKFYLTNGHMPKNQTKGYGLNLMRLVTVLDNSKMGLDLINDQDLSPIFGDCGFCYFILMNKLMEHKQYESVLDLFHKQLAFFSEQNSGGKVLDKRKLKNSIPYDQASIVIEALLYMNSKESLEKLKEMFELFKTRNFKINNIIVSRAFLLALNQNDYNFALQMLADTKFLNLDHSLARNLTIIALCRMDLVTDAIKVANNLNNLSKRGYNSLDLSDKTKFIGRFFPITLKDLNEAVNRCGTDENKQDLDQLKADLEEGDRLFHIDLKEYCHQVL